MKPSITPAERLRVAAFLREGYARLGAMEAVEQDIATILGVTPTEDRDLITDAISLPLTVDVLLARLAIRVEESV